MRSSFGGQIGDVRADSSSELIWDLLFIFSDPSGTRVDLWSFCSPQRRQLNLQQEQEALFLAAWLSVAVEYSTRRMKVWCSGWKKSRLENTAVENGTPGTTQQAK